MITTQQALKIILSQSQDFGIEEVHFLKSLGRILKEDIIADRDFPPFDRVSMDGIAIDFATLKNGITTFPIENIQAAGAEQLTLRNNQNCIEVMTGAVLPKNTNTVIPYELVAIEDGKAMPISANVNQNQNIHKKGLDRKQNDVLIKQNTIISSAEMGVIATVGKAKVKVSKQPKVMIVSTGDELVEIDQIPLNYQIRKSNIYTLVALLQELKIEAKTAHIDDDKAILKGINLEVKAGEVHAIMGPNGSGKSTLASVIAGKDEYEMTEGEILFENENINELSPEERAHKGVFLSFQYPVEIPGVSVTNFIRTAINETRKAKGLPDMPANEMLKMIREKSEMLEIDRKFLSRSLNEGFSGGEKKRNEIFQLAMLEPKLAILDETDSGLDIDALRIVASGVNKIKSEDNAVIIITHYQRLLDHIVPDFVHVLHEGRIVKSGGKELAHELEEKGYDWIKEELNA